MRFIDTSFFVALMRSRERHHDEARHLWALDQGPLMTTVGVVGETWTFLRRREHHAAATRAVQAIRSSTRIVVVDTGPEEHEAAWAWLQQHDEHEYSFVDAVSFEVMRRRRLSEALAFDGDFTRAGFIEIRA
ncbi:MAG: PIN domain-containing protein [Actinobacteria bacterium]|nr:PIN domain-containing protein [Actinomycetota bacterium]MCB9388231.1 PIN domain-containing protein [Acidimicrobiia bacterium]